MFDEMIMMSALY